MTEKHEYFPEIGYQDNDSRIDREVKNIPLTKNS